MNSKRISDSSERILDPSLSSGVGSQSLPPKRPPQNQQFTALPKLHLADCTQKLYLRSAIDQTLSRVEDLPKDVDKHTWEREYGRLRQLLRMYRQAGRIGWGRLWLRNALRFAFSLCLAGAFVVAITPANVHYRVLRKFNTFDFQLQKVVYGRPQAPFVWHGCHDVNPPLFQPGFTLTKFVWSDRGTCAEIPPIPDAYVIERDSNGWPKIPDNCLNPADADSFCNGAPKFD